MGSHVGAVRGPREWLASVVRDVAHNLRRRRVRRLAHKTAAARHDVAPSSAELLLRQERRGEIARAVDALPAPLALSELRIRIVHGDEPVVETTYRATTDRPVPRSWARWLAPGEYSIEANGDGLSGQAGFTVQVDGDEIVRVALR